MPDDPPRRAWDPEIDPHFFLTVCSAFECLRKSYQRWRKANQSEMEAMSPGFLDVRATEMQRRVTGAEQALQILYRFADQHYLALDMAALAAVSTIASPADFNRAQDPVAAAESLALRYMAERNIRRRSSTPDERQTTGIVDYILADRTTGGIDEMLSLQKWSPEAAAGIIAVFRKRGISCERFAAYALSDECDGLTGAIRDLQQLRASVAGVDGPLTETSAEPIVRSWTLIRGLRLDPPNRITIDGRTETINAAAFDFISALARARGYFVPDKALPPGRRPARVYRSLPDFLKPIVQRVRGMGSRIIR